MLSVRTPAHWLSVWIARFAIAGVAAAALPGARQVPPPPEGAPTTPALMRLLDGREVESVSGGYQYAEGPLWHPDGYLLFADSPRDRLLKWDPASNRAAVFREPSAGATALGFDGEGRLLATEHRNRRISRTDRDGSIVTVVDRYEGKRLNSPNDFVVSRTGSIFFTDPPYGLPRQEEGKELDFQGVYRLDPDGRLRLLVRDMVRPNGIGLSPDERSLYVSDTERRHLRAFALRDDGSVDHGRVLAEMRPWKRGVHGVPDGLVVSSQGHVLVTGPGGVWVFDANGGRLGVIATPEPPAACGFGDADGKTLYITARTRVYRIRMTVGAG
jgi:sugar lactone lactonase YvrE